MSETAPAAVDEPDATSVTEIGYNETNSDKKMEVLKQFYFAKVWSRFWCANGSNSNLTIFLHYPAFFL